MRTAAENRNDSRLVYFHEEARPGVWYIWESCSPRRVMTLIEIVYGEEHKAIALRDSYQKKEADKAES